MTSKIDRNTGRRRWYALILLCAAQFIVVLDASVINVALPAIGRELGVDQQALAWVVSAYVLAFGGFLLLGGRAADLLGRRKVFAAGLVLFGVASLVGGFASSIEVLVAARAVQGLGAAALSPAAMSIITVTFQDGADRNRAFAAWGAVGAAGGAAGVVLGGTLTQYAGWEWILWINVPIVAVCVAAVRPLLTESRAGAVSRVFDLAGAITVTGGLTLLAYALVESPAMGRLSGRTVLTLVTALVMLAAFVVIERRSSNPLVDLTIFGLRNLTGANIAGLIIGGIIAPMFFFLSLYMQNVLGYDAIMTGLCLLPMCVVAFGTSIWLGGGLITRLGYKAVLATGLTALGAGLIWLGGIRSDGSFAADLLAPSLIIGAALGLVFAPLFVAASTGVSWDQAGLASGLINTSQQVGGALGLAVLSGIAFVVIDSHGTATPEALTSGYRIAFIGAAVLAVIGLVVTATVIRSRNRAALAATTD